MTNALLTSTEPTDLLAIPIDEPERLFSKRDFKQQYRQLTERWHDHQDVRMHIQALYIRASDKMRAGNWQDESACVLRGTDGSKYVLTPRIQHTFELGQALISDTSVLYLIDPQQRDLYERAIQMVRGFAYADEPMESKIAPLLPAIEAAFETLPLIDGQPKHLALMLRKTEDVFPLNDVLAHHCGALDPRHVAWILSGLHHLACWLEWSGLAHNAISPETIFISPKFHSVLLLGGWSYATKVGEKFVALPRASANALPDALLASKQSTALFDQILIRRLGLQMLGAIDTNSDMASRQLGLWLTQAPKESATQNYADWEHARDSIFGARKFIPFELSADDLYPTDTIAV